MGKSKKDKRIPSYSVDIKIEKVELKDQVLIIHKDRGIRYNIPFKKWENLSAKKIKFKDEYLHVHLKDGRIMSETLENYPRLKNATPKQRLNYTMSGDGYAFHWEKLDEDIVIDEMILYGLFNVGSELFYEGKTNTESEGLYAVKIWFADDKLWIEQKSGVAIGMPLSRFSKLDKATPEERENYNITDEGFMIHWDALGIHISMETILYLMRTNEIW